MEQLKQVQVQYKKKASFFWYQVAQHEAKRSILILHRNKTLWLYGLNLMFILQNNPSN